MKIKTLNKIKFIIFLLLIAILIKSINAEVYMGTCEGYVYNTENKNVSDAKVSITVNKCSSDCSRETLSESSGYYMTANLNLPKLQALTVYAEKNTPLGLEYGSSSGTSNEFQAAEINVRLCLPPLLPVLVNQSDSHKKSTSLEWNSYPDKKNYPVYDEFQLDSNTAIKSNNHGKKKIEANDLRFSNHIWRVRTCNNYCCSDWVYDNFMIENSPPSKPVLSDQADTIPGQITLSWSSGTDPDKDPTYDEYEFSIINEKKEKIIPAKSPIIQDVFGCHFYEWNVRTCEKTVENLCSEWSRDSFFACGIECPACNPVEIICSTGDSGSSSTIIEIKNETKQAPDRYIFENTLYTMFVNSPQYVYSNEKFHLKISFSTSIELKDIIFKVDSPYFQMNDYIISELSQRNAGFNMTGKAKDPRPGIYPLTLNVYLKGAKIISEPIEIEIKERKLEIPSIKNFPLWPFIIAIIILIIMYLAYRYMKKRGS